MCERAKEGRQVEGGRLDGKGGNVMTGVSRRFAALSLVCALALVCTMAYGQDAQLAGPTRGNAIHLAYTPTVRSMGMGGASIGLEGPDSFNPAALGWLETGEIEITYGDHDFRKGPRAQYYRADVSYPVLGGGAQLKLYYMDSNKHLSEMPGPSMPLEAKVWAYELGVAYGRKLGDRLSVGFGAFPLEESNLRLSGFGRGRGESLVGSARLGVLFKFTDQINLATMFDHIKDRLDDSYDWGTSLRDNYYANIWTVGGAIKLTDKIRWFGDYRWGRVNGGSVRLNPRSPNFGLEYQFTDDIALRVGETRGHITAGAGLKLGSLGMDLLKNCELNYAYVDGTGEDMIRRAFGTATSHAVSLSMKF